MDPTESESQCHSDSETEGHSASDFAIAAESGSDCRSKSQVECKSERECHGWSMEREAEPELGHRRNVIRQKIPAFLQH
jgi:hypothetical protein